MRPYEGLYNVFYKKALAVGHEIDLTYEDFLEFTKIKECHYCGGEVKWAKTTSSKATSAYNLDRTDNSKGYVKGNLVVCCKRCNFLKSDKFSYDEFVEIGKQLRLFRIPKEPIFERWVPE